MARLTVSRHLDHLAAAVWDRLADLEGHAGWMSDAERITFTSDTRRGAGASMIVRTRVGPFRTDDVLEVTDWDEGRSITVRHGGTVTGIGVLRVDPEGTGSRVTWTEELRFPWWLGGPVTAWLAAPVLRRVWLRNLENLTRSTG